MKKLITVCTSMRFYSLASECADRLRSEGHEVLMPEFFASIPTDTERERLGRLHLEKILRSDAIYVVDPNGYIGDAVRREIEYASLHGKKIMYME